jgi:RES domain-containing protein
MVLSLPWLHRSLRCLLIASAATQDTPTLTRAWFNERRTALLRVPSAIVPAAFNYLLNPMHPDAARVSVVAQQTAEFDARLFGRLTPAGGR